jgi:hypothetical protein
MCSVDLILEIGQPSGVIAAHWLAFLPASEMLGETTGAEDLIAAFFGCVRMGSLVFGHSGCAVLS